MSDYAVWQVHASRRRAPEVQKALIPLCPEVRVTVPEGMNEAPADLSFTVSCHGVAKKLVMPETIFMTENAAAAIVARVRIELEGFLKET